MGHTLMAVNSKEIRRSIRVVRASVRGKVHRSVLVRVDNICTLIEQVLPRADELGDGSAEMHLLSRTATDYLPGALNPYLSLPRDYAERVPLSDGRTAIASLCAQLDVMYAQMWQVVEAVLRSDGDKLLANERFLDEKFGHNPLNLPPDSTPTADQRRNRGKSQGKPQAQAQNADQNPPLSSQIVTAVSQVLIERMRSRKKP
ncbi:MAG: hypothetical protein WCI74_03730 [Actinomycetes bacterium]